MSQAAFEQAVLDALAALKAEVGSLKAEVGSLKAEVGSLKAEVGSLKAEVGSLKAEVGSLKAAVASLESRMTAVEKRVGSLETQSLTLHTGHARELRELRNDFGHHFVNLETRVSALEIQSVEVAHRLNEVAATGAATYQAVTAMVGQLRDHEARITALEDR